MRVTSEPSIIDVKEAPGAASRRKSRIVVCALSTYSKIGGLQNFNRRLFQSLGSRARRGAEPLVVVAGDDKATLPASSGFEIVAPHGRAAFLLQVFAASVSQGGLLLICHINLLALAVAVRLFRPRLPIVLFVHGFEAWNGAGRPRRHFERLALRCVDRVVSVSRYTAGVMSREFGVPIEKFRILPNAVDEPAQGPVVARKPFSILTVTRLGAAEREKNVHEMIEAVALLRARAPQLTYEIVGDGALRPQLEELARQRGVDDVVTFRGLVDADALREAYARASVFAMPSDKEGFGIVYLEAWQYGLPVICSMFGAASEVVADEVDGFVVDPHDVEALAERLGRLLLDPALAREMGERGREKVVSKYLDADFRGNLFRILDEVVREAGSEALAGGSKLTF
ncbi:glycosyltransferase family 4 protein [Methylocella sp.]|uniref:glycosyltransferase family 4 protein n=1 Tax=Methylocella sp. TaxID=1978226 RepID=UPI0035AEF89B